MSARFAPVPIRVDTSKLSDGDKRALAKLVEAARVVDHLFLQQLWSGNLNVYAGVAEGRVGLGQGAARILLAEQESLVGPR